MVTAGYDVVIVMTKCTILASSSVVLFSLPLPPHMLSFLSGIIPLTHSLLHLEIPLSYHQHFKGLKYIMSPPLWGGITGAVLKIYQKKNKIVLRKKRFRETKGKHSSTGAPQRRMAQWGMDITLAEYNWEVWGADRGGGGCDVTGVGRMGSRGNWWDLRLSPCSVFMTTKSEKWQLWRLTKRKLSRDATEIRVKKVD